MHVQFADAQFVAATDHIFTYYTVHHNNLSSEKIMIENKNMKTDRSFNTSGVSSLMAC